MKNIITLLLSIWCSYILAQDTPAETPQKTDFSYNNTQDSIKKLDTLRTYNVDLYETQTPFGVKYTVNGREITKKKYDEYRSYWTTLDACTPCLLNTYDVDDDLMHVAYQYETCLCGEYTAYYKDGSKKMEGNFMNNPNGNWDNYKLQQFCNRKIGEWKYYYPNGNIEKIEEYQNGVLVKVIKGKTELVPAVDVYKRNQQNTYDNEEEEDTLKEKKSIFQRLKK
jgi:hypothetical protein